MGLTNSVPPKHVLTQIRTGKNVFIAEDYVSVQALSKMNHAYSYIYCHNIVTGYIKADCCYETENPDVVEMGRCLVVFEIPPWQVMVKNNNMGLLKTVRAKVVDYIPLDNDKKVVKAWTLYDLELDAKFTYNLNEIVEGFDYKEDLGRGRDGILFFLGKKEAENYGNRG